MNIMHVIGSLAPEGAQIYLEKLVYQTEGQKSAVGVIRNHVVCLTDDRVVGYRLAAAGIPVSLFDMRRPAGFVAAPLHLARLIRRSRPVIVNAWMYHSNLVATLATGLAGGAPLIWGIHNHPISNRNLRAYTSIRLGALLSRHAPGAIVHVSHNVRRSNEAAGYDPRKSHVIHIGFDPGHFRPDPSARVSVRQELGLADNTLLIGFASRFVPFKNHKLFLSSLGRLKADNVHAVLCGGGNEPGNHDLTRLIDDAGVSGRVHLLGPRQDVPRLTAAWDVAVNSSYREGFPNAVGEALMAAIPCVTTDIGDITEAVSRAGHVIHTFDPDDLAAAIDSILALTPEERMAMGQRGRQHISETYSLEINTQKWMALYDALTSGKKSRSRSS